ncbi:MAG TPA: cupin domain-containing protein [Nitrososphaeraceae archaeon]|nr:cupin domain-containing protein [Nitrososphaeraceae archaeon]
MEEKLIDIRELFSKMDLGNSEFLDFFDLRHLQAGILRLKPGERDKQEPHSSDEIYLVLEGDGFIEIGKKTFSLKKDLFIYVPANVKHRFYGNKQEILVVYLFSD